MTEVEATPYDEIVYPSFLHDYLHPDRLATIAWLRGVDAAPADACTYLELGAGDGATLIALAVAYPGSRFVGIDLAPTIVERGAEVIRALGLTNVELLVGDLADPELADRVAERPVLEGRPLDYVVSHGVFSWVPEPARLGTLATAERLLAPHGVLYLSYNAYPGGHLRELVRGMLAFHIKGRSEPLDPEGELAESLGLLNLIADARADDLWGQLLQAELSVIDHRTSASLHHDELAEINQHYWLHEVAQLADDHGLSFVGEADDIGDKRLGWSPAVSGMLDALWEQPVVREQYADLLLGRRFRRTLWARSATEPVWPYRSGRFDALLVGSPATFTSGRVDLTPGVDEQIVVAPGESNETALSVDGTLAKAALAALADAWPAHLPFGRLVADARRRALPHRADLERGTDGFDDDAATIADFLTMVQAARVIQLRHRPATHHLEPSARPTTSPLIAHQLSLGRTTVATLDARHLEVGDPLSLFLLRTCDGTRDVVALAALASEDGELAALIGSGHDAHERVEAQIGRLAALSCFVG